MAPRRSKRAHRETTPQPPSPQVQESSGDEEEVETLRATSKPFDVKSGMYLDESELDVPELWSLLDELNLGTICKFHRDWYPSIVRKFYSTGTFTTSDARFEVDDVDYRLTKNHIRNYFGMVSGDVGDYPERGWSANWPVSQEEVCEFLNNGREVLHPGFVLRNNLTGFQKLVFKVIFSILLPTNNMASYLSISHSFVLYALLKKMSLDMPRMMIRHMEHQQKKRYAPYGMILSALLTDELGVPIHGEPKAEIKNTSRVGTQSLVSQNLFSWNHGIYTKWEIETYFADQAQAVWRYNNCLPGGRARPSRPAVRQEAYPPPPPNQLHIEGPSSSSTSYMTDRQLMDRMYAEMQTMNLNVNNRFNGIEERVVDLQGRVRGIEDYIEEERRRREDFNFDL